MNDCIFCNIAEKKVSSTLAYENASYLAFHDHEPQAPTHILIIPKKHIAHLYDVQSSDQGIFETMIFIANQLAKEKAIDQKGYRLVLNCNPQGGQTVDHIHLHLLGGRNMKWPPG